MQKTAAASRDGAAYLLYGPSEKRICPKLAAKNIGNVVSEYICRYHCLDGIVIDDNKTICGEALWRANVMDKQTREYVDRDGNITGGYIEKRFEVDHTTVPEENKMRLKPGEIRKPRPAAWGNLESRLQDMRSKEGKKRGYRPETDTSKPFNWAKDVDQNNVEQTQAERNRRETAAGHELVEVKNRDEAENSPEIKRAFNLKSYKTGSGSVDFLRQIEKAGGQIPINPELQQQLSAAQQSHWVEVKGNMVVLTDVGKRVLEGAGPAQVPGMTNVMNDQSQALQGAANQVQQGADLRTDVAKDMEKQQHNQAKWLKERQQERESGATGENLALPTSGAAQASFNMKSFKTAKVEEINVPGLRNEKANDAPLVKDTEEACPCEQKKKEKVANTIPIPNVTTDPQQAGGVIVQDDQGIISNPRMRRTRREQLEHQLDVEDTAKALAMD
jgi:hypothetical protein